MAEAICSVTDTPFPSEPYILTMLSCRSPTLLYIRSMSATASVSPKAFCSSIFSAASIVSPNLPRRMSRISGILRSWLLASVNLSPSSSPPLVALRRKALYFVPASAPPIVACSIPKTESCSSSGTCAVVADAPRFWIACAMPEPEVLNARTASEMPAENISPNSMSLRSL